MNGIKAWTVLGLSLAGLMVLAGCAGGGRVEGTADDEDNNDENDDDIGGTAEGGGRGGASPGLGPLLVVGGLGVAGAWTARRLSR